MFRCPALAPPCVREVRGMGWARRRPPGLSSPVEVPVARHRMRFMLVASATFLGLAASDSRLMSARDRDGDAARVEEARHRRAEKTLYIWAGDQARTRPDFLAVIDLDERSRSYGRVLRTVPLPPPGNMGNEPHHCHLSEDGNILACGGLLSVLKDQDGIFFFDVSNPRRPEFLFSTRAPHSAVT